MIRNLKNKKKKGFTLVELIIVIAIIAILVAIAVPQFGKIREKANINADMANAKSIYSAIAACVAEETVDSTQPAGAEDEDDIELITDDADLLAYLGGINNIPTPKAYQNSTFNFNVIDGNITVYVVTTQADVDATYEIYPSADAASKYAKVK